MYKFNKLFFLQVLSALLFTSCQSTDNDEPLPTEPEPEVLEIMVNPDIVLNDVSSRPFGINTNTLTDGQNNLAPGARPLSDALEEIGVKYLRFPGGEKSDVYMWASPPFVSPTTASLSRISPVDFPAGFSEFWSLSQNTWTNDNYNFDEFMTDCQSVGGEPVIVVALDGIYKPAFSGGTSLTREVALEMATKWVEYANITKGYNVKYWSLGNETWNNDSYAGANPGFVNYGEDVALFAQAMKAVDPSIKIGINGNSYTHFTEALSQCAQWVDFLDIHVYPCFGFNSYSDYENEDLDINGIITAAKTASNAFPAENGGERFLAMTETSAYGFQEGEWDEGANLGQSLANFELLATLATDSRVQFTQFWNTRWINNNLETPQPTDVFTKENELNANGKALALLHNNLHEKMVKSTKTNKIKSFASLDSNTGELTIFLLNKSQESQSIKVLLENYAISGDIQQSSFSGSSTQDIAPTINDLPNLNAVNNEIELTLNSTSITLLKLF